MTTSSLPGASSRGFQLIRGWWISGVGTEVPNLVLFLTPPPLTSIRVSLNYTNWYCLPTPIVLHLLPPIYVVALCLNYRA
ncbi:hypothetical protein OPQ81_006628 [Rhizoctonia solani]|nr:hypothetical protein OPQ81_006628 [Rhizoctonia solani]